MIRYASVLGTTFDPELLAAAMHDDLALDQTTWSRFGDLVEQDPGGGFRFRNALIREAAYEGLPYRRRRQLHSWLAEAIELRAGDRADDEAAMLSVHFREAQQWEKAWRYARRAAEPGGGGLRQCRGGRRARARDRIREASA